MSSAWQKIIIVERPATDDPTLLEVVTTVDPAATNHRRYRLIEDDPTLPASPVGPGVNAGTCDVHALVGGDDGEFCPDCLADQPGTASPTGPGPKGGQRLHLREDLTVTPGYVNASCPECGRWRLEAYVVDGAQPDRLVGIRCEKCGHEPMSPVERTEGDEPRTWTLAELTADALCDRVITELIVQVEGESGRGRTSDRVPLARWDLAAAFRRALGPSESEADDAR